jgi:hypothetical protein
VADRETYDPDERRRCTGRTRTGARCSKRAVAGTDRCAHHTFRVPGRPRKVNPELTERMVDVLLDGNFLETAAAIVGVNKTTVYRWMRRAEELEAAALEHTDDTDVEFDLYQHVDPRDWPLLDFCHAVKSASAYAEAELLRKVRLAGLGWQAFAWTLERRHPTHWGRRKTFDHTFTGEVGVGGKVELIVPDSDEKRRAIAGILDSLGVLDEDAAGDETENTTP